MNIVRSILGLDNQQQPLNDGPSIEDQAKPASSPKRDQTPYVGLPVPLDASFDPQDSKALYSEMTDEFNVVPANDGTSVLVFSIYFKSESPETKRVVYSEEMNADPSEPKDHPKRLRDTVRIYEHLLRDREPHPRVVRFLGATPSGYRLERLSPGPAAVCTDVKSDAVLALHQRWAMQVLSALQWGHERGVTLQWGAVQQDAFWLRSDFSVAIACLVTAGCLELQIPAEHWSSNNFVSPWSKQTSGRSEPPYTWHDTGLPKGDLVDWATWVYGLMIGKASDPLLCGLDKSNPTGFCRKWKQRHKATEKGRFRDWPRLPKEQLGDVLVRAWSGDYETAGEVLADVRQALKDTGRQLTAGKTDEIDGFDWNHLFEVVPGKFGPKLQLKQQNC